ncbi:MAG TPA: type II toxin-antitoxin system antitoxin SocA domain-containing protein [Chitinophaga sp.]
MSNFDNMPYSSRQIANFFIKSSQNTGDELTPMKLIKLCYIAHGWNLALYNEALLDEAIQAWQYGPVIQSIYRDFKHYGNSQITELVKVGDEYPLPNPAAFPLLNKIWDVYKKYDGVQLSAMTHQPETPWDITWNDMGGKQLRAAIIPNNLIQQHYLQKIQRTPNEQQPARN